MHTWATYLGTDIISAVVKQIQGSEAGFQLSKRLTVPLESEIVHGIPNKSENATLQLSIF